MMVLCYLELQRSNTKIMFHKEKIFSGDLSTEKQKESVPSPLFHLILLILDSGSILDNENANSKNIAVNIGQLNKLHKT